MPCLYVPRTGQSRFGNENFDARGKRSALLAKNFSLAAKRLIAWIKRLTNDPNHLGPRTMHFIHVEK